MAATALAETPEFKPRDYQIEIFEEACKRNVIACLGTGTGKTFISVMLIKELAHQIRGSLKEGGKRTIFVVTTVPLVSQQGKVIENCTQLKVGKYTGEMNVDSWDKNAWEQQFNEYDVLVMTHQILLNNLMHGFMKPSSINLLIIDECHHTKKNHPYMKIMQEIEGMRDIDRRPRVMGLTASIINEKARKRGQALRYYLEQQMKELEMNLRAVCFTCVDQSSTLMYATRPEETIRTYPAISYTDMPEAYETSRAMQDLLRMKPVKPTSKLGKLHYEKCDGILKDLAELLSTLGIWSTYKAALLFRSSIGTNHSNNCLSLASNVVERIIELFEMYAMKCFGGVANVLLMQPIIAPKVYALLEVLTEMKEERDLCAIVFVKRRVTSKVISDLINQHADRNPCFSGIKCDFVHGHSLLDIVAGGSDSGTMTSKKQEKILKRFREGEFNVLISTSVVEEGLDVRKCNLVVKFDCLDNFREYVQSKGRARAPESRFIVLAEKGLQASEACNDIQGMQEVEKFLVEKCRGRELPTDEEISESRSEEIIKRFKVSDEEGAASISMDNAVNLLFMYCSKLPSDHFTHLVPCFRFKLVAGELISTVTLPLNSPLNYDIEGESMPTKRLARISAAQRACIYLYEIGELDDNFVPKSNYDSSDDEDESKSDSAEGDCQDGSQKAWHVYERKVPDCLTPEEPFPSSFHLYALEINLNESRSTAQAHQLRKFWDQEDRNVFGLLTAKLLPPVPSFPLFTNAGEVTVNVKHVQSAVCLSPSQLKSVARFHKEMMQQFVERFVPGWEFSWSQSSVALLVAIKGSNSYFVEKKPKSVCPIDFVFMKKLCSKDSSKCFGTESYEDSVIRKTYADTESLFYVSMERADLKVTNRIAQGKPTFQEYYQEKYGIYIRPGQPLLESVRASSRLNLISPRFSDDLRKTAKSGPGKSGVVHLVPELCKKLLIPASFHCQLVCLPSLLYRLETMLNAEYLRRKMTQGIRGEIIAGYTCSVWDDTTFECTDDFARIMRKPKPCDKTTPSNCSDVHKSKVSSEMRAHMIYKKMASFLLGSSDKACRNIAPHLILQSLTTSKADAGFDLETLETLGDSFLKAATTIYLYFKHPHQNEGKLTRKRIRLVSNERLLKEALSKEVPQMMCNTAFGLKRAGNEEEDCILWIPPMFIEPASEAGKLPAKARQIIRNKPIADCIEAFIGAFFAHGGIVQALKVMKWFGIPCFYEDLNEEDRNFRRTGKYANFVPPTTALYDWDTGSTAEEQARYVQEEYEKSRFQGLEEKINYSFKDKSFLIQAFTHMSYYRNKATGCYQRLEFLGDALLDLLIVVHLYAWDHELDPSSMTNMKSALVNNNTFALLVIKNSLHKYLMHFEQKITAALGKFSDLTDEEIENQLKNPFIIKFDDDEDEGFHAPKFLGDLFESLAGAIFLDSGLDLVQVWKVFYPIMQPLIDRYLEDVPLNPVRQLYEHCSTASPRCHKFENGKIKCTWHVDGKDFHGVGQNTQMAKAAAALNAIYELRI